MKTKEQKFNCAEFELGDFSNEYGVNKGDLLVFFHSMSKALGYDSSIFVEFLDSRTDEKELSRDIKVSEGY